MTPVQETLDLSKYIDLQFDNGSNLTSYFLDKPFGHIRKLYVENGAEFNKKYSRWIVKSDNKNFDILEDYISIFLKTPYRNKDAIKPGAYFDEILKCFYISNSRLSEYKNDHTFLKTQILTDNISWIFNTNKNVKTIQEWMQGIRGENQVIDNDKLSNSIGLPTASTAIVSPETYIKALSLNGYILSDIGKAIAKTTLMTVIGADDILYTMLGKIMMTHTNPECLVMISKIDKNYKHIHVDTHEEEYVSFLLDNLKEECDIQGLQLFVHHSEKCFTLIDNDIVDEPTFKNHFNPVITVSDEPVKVCVPTRNPDLWTTNSKNLPIPSRSQKHTQYTYDEPNEEYLAKVELAAYDLYDPEYGLNISELAAKMEIISGNKNVKIIRDCLHYLWYHCYKRKISHPSNPNDSKQEYWWKIK